jgi:glycosyltransferase involved in cell wall biosynthesis
VKVLHIAAGVLFGGVETLLVTLAKLRHLCPEMEPHFGLCFPGRLRDALHAAGVPVHDLGSVRVSRPWTVLRARWRLRRVLRANGIDAAVTHGMWPHAVFAPRVQRSGVRLVAAIHDILDGRHWVNRLAARTRPEVVVANSHFTAPPAAALFSQPAPVLRYPVSPPSSDSDRIADRSAVREQLGTSADAVVILQACRLERWKGQAVHIEALGRLKYLAGWEAWFAGGPQKAGEAELLAELKASAARLGIAQRLKFLGQRSDVPRLMAAADVYCQPNTGPEPFGISFVEALYAGLPVVASESGGAAEIVTANCGVLCPPGNAGVVAAALGELIANADRRQTLSAAGPTRATALCDPTRQLAALASAIRSKRE